MLKNTYSKRTFRAASFLTASIAVSGLIYLFSPFIAGSEAALKFRIEDISDILFTAAVILHLLWIPAILFSRKKMNNAAVKSADFFISTTLMFFLFNYLFAANAGLEYVQRFAETSDVLSFAPDTSTERLLTAFLFLPLLAADIFAAVKFGKKKIFSPDNMNLPLTLLSSLLYAFSFPSFLNIDGWGFLIFISFIPLLTVLKNTSVRRGIFYGIVFGIFQTMIINYWLATFSLVSLQFVTVLYTLLFTFFMSFAVFIYKKSRAGWLLFPFAWIVFEWARSSGFSAYPWCLTGSALYKYLPFIQIASVTGIWGISFTAVLINTALTEALYPVIRRRRKRPAALYPLITAAVITAAVTLFGISEISRDRKIAADKTISLSLIQQNSDPRKTSYEESFEVLKKLTDAARREKETDLVVWSETAYVPNIRRWGSIERDYNALTRLTHSFFDYQREGGFFLLTGNDDYEIITDENGDVSRNEYNASVYFSDRGERLDTYRKIKLVPFTEYFPFRNQLPWMYEILMKMDVNLWEPGITRTVFRHPEFSFSTPICFEDLFPDYVRGFVTGGADMIINISNDYWSLTETEGMQHFINSLFRAVENRRYVVRSTASGLTGVIDRTGKIQKTVPFYEQHYLNAEIPVSTKVSRSLTFYTRHGDWFPFISLIVFASSFPTYICRDSS